MLLKNSEFINFNFFKFNFIYNYLYLKKNNLKLRIVIRGYYSYYNQFTNRRFVYVTSKIGLLFDFSITAMSFFFSFYQKGYLFGWYKLERWEKILNLCKYRNIKKYKSFDINSKFSFDSFYILKVWFRTFKSWQLNFYNFFFNYNFYLFLFKNMYIYWNFFFRSYYYYYYNGNNFFFEKLKFVEFIFFKSDNILFNFFRYKYFGFYKNVFKGFRKRFFFFKKKNFFEFKFFKKLNYFFSVKNWYYYIKGVFKMFTLYYYARENLGIDYNSDFYKIRSNYIFITKKKRRKKLGKYNIFVKKKNFNFIVFDFSFILYIIRDFSLLSFFYFYFFEYNFNKIFFFNFYAYYY